MTVPIFRLFLAFSLLLTGCQTPAPINVEHLSYSRSVEKLNVESSFGFLHQGHTYDFVLAHSPEYKDGCSRFDGYKDDQLTYSFPSNKIKQLTEVYSAKESVDSKINRSLQLIEAIQPRRIVCERKPPPPPKSLPAKAMSLAVDTISIGVLGYIVVLLSPILVPMWLNEKNESTIARIRQIRLGETLDRVTREMGYSFQEDWMGEHNVRVYDIAETSYTK